MQSIALYHVDWSEEKTLGDREERGVDDNRLALAKAICGGRDEFKEWLMKRNKSDAVSNVVAMAL